MNIIVVGCGRVGSHLATLLSEDGHNVSVIDRNADSFKNLGRDFNGRIVKGVGFDESALMEAGMRAAEAGGAEAAAAEAEAGGKGCVLLMPAEEDTERNFAPVVSYYEVLCERMGWRDLGRVLAGGVYRAGDIAGNPALDEARELGAGLR